MVDVERIRTRAKDSKAEYVKYYADHAFASLVQIRSLLITITTAGVGYFLTVSTVCRNVTTLLIWAFLAGLLSYAFHYLAMWGEVKHYLELEKIFATSSIPLDTYNDMLEKEVQVRKAHHNIYWLLSLISLVAQALLILAFLVFAFELKK